MVHAQNKISHEIKTLIDTNNSVFEEMRDLISIQNRNDEQISISQDSASNSRKTISNRSEYSSVINTNSAHTPLVKVSLF